MYCPLWENALTSEQFYGIVGVEPGVNSSVSIIIDGQNDDWIRRAQVEQVSTFYFPSFQVKASHDPEFFYLLLEKPSSQNWSLPDEALFIGFDVIAGGPNRTDQTGNITFWGLNGVEELLQLRERDYSSLSVGSHYDTLDFLYGSSLGYAPADDTLFNSFRQPMETTSVNISQCNITDPFQIYDAGKCIFGTTDNNSNANWFMSNNIIEVKIPWLMLGFADPCHSEVHSYLYNQSFSLVTTTGFQFQIALVSDLTQTTIVHEPVSYNWSSWENDIEYYYRRKLSFNYFKNAVAGVQRVKSRSISCIPRAPCQASLQNCSSISISAPILPALQETIEIPQNKLPPITIYPPQVALSVTTGIMTTSPITTSPLTTGPITTGQITTSPLTTAPLSTGPLTTSSITTSLLTTNIASTGSLSTLATNPVSTAAQTTTGVSNEVTTATTGIIASSTSAANSVTTSFIFQTTGVQTTSTEVVSTGLLSTTSVAHSTTGKISSLTTDSTTRVQTSTTTTTGTVPTSFALSTTAQRVGTTSSPMTSSQSVNNQATTLIPVGTTDFTSVHTSQQVTTQSSSFQSTTGAQLPETSSTTALSTSTTGSPGVAATTGVESTTTVGLILEGDVSTFQPSNFKTSMSTVLDCSPDNIDITGISSASVAVNFTIINVVGVPNVDANSLIAQLQLKVRTNDSTLAAAGLVVISMKVYATTGK